jgi:uncharacterized alkaline shock family protein YloU
METWQTGTTITEGPAKQRPANDAAGAEQPGHVRIAHRVLRTIVREAALDVPVARLAEDRTFWSGFLGLLRPRGGVGLAVRDNSVAVDLYMVVAEGVNMVEVGEAVQEAVEAAIERMLGMRASAIDVYIRDVA